MYKIKEDNMIGKLIKDHKLWGYVTDETEIQEPIGIVLADHKVQALEKVKAAYIKHGYTESSLMNVKVWELDPSSWFQDSPDVLEVFS